MMRFLKKLTQPLFMVLSILLLFGGVMIAIRSIQPLPAAKEDSVIDNTTVSATLTGTSPAAAA